MFAWLPAMRQRSLRILSCLFFFGAGLSPAMSGELISADRWRACEGDVLQALGFECATLRRPLERQQPSGAQVELAIYRLPATGGAEQRIGTLFFNPGGPGQPGHTSANKAFFLPPSLRRSFDFVTWDPRGLGRSSPALEGCLIGFPRRPAQGTVDWTLVHQARAEELRQANQDCIRRHQGLIRGMGTVEVAHDLEALRRALGESQLTYWGISYGTVIGSTYAALFPDKVRALVLDGSVDPWAGLEGLSASALAPDDAIRFFLQTHPDLKPVFERVIQALNRRSLQLADGAPYTRWDLLDNLARYVPITRIAGSYGRAMLETLDQALFGRAEAQQLALNRLTDPLFRTPAVDGNAGAGFSAVTCRDFPQRPSLMQQRTMLAGLVEKAPLYGGSLAVDFLTVCSGYDAVAADPIPRAPFARADAPGLIIGSTWDGSTPWRWSTAMARAFPAMRTLTVVGNEHGLFTNVQSACLDNAVVRYLETAEVPATDQVCPYEKPVKVQPMS